MRSYGTFVKTGDILYITYPEFESTIEEYKEYLVKQEKYIKEGPPMTIVYDASKSKYLSVDNRINQSNWIKENNSILKSNVKLMIFIIPSISVRLLLKVMLAISPLPCPNKVVASMNEANESLNIG